MPTVATEQPNQDLQATIETAPELAQMEPRQRELVTQVVMQAMHSEHFKAPIAHPSHMKAYGEVDPSIPGRIMGMAETAQLRSEDREDKKLANDHRYRMVGLCLGFVAFALITGSGIALVINGYGKAGLTLLSVGVIGTAARIFVDGRQAQSSTKEKQPAKPPSRKSPTTSSKR